MNWKKITQDELDVFLRKHKLWLADEPGGERADLYGANLSRADLSGANLSGANLYGANLYPHLNWYHPNVIDNNLYITLWKLGELTELTAFAKHSIVLSMPDADSDYIPTIEIVDK